MLTHIGDSVYDEHINLEQINMMSSKIVHLRLTATVAALALLEHNPTEFGVSMHAVPLPLETGGFQKELAERSGISQSTLNRAMPAYGTT